MAATSVLFRVEASPDIGVGHLQRCLSLAGALRHVGAECLFLMNKGLIIHDWVKRLGFEGHTLGAIKSWGEDDVSHTIAIANTNGCVAIVVDSDCEGADYLNELRCNGLFVCAIEDAAPHPFPCQLVVNGDAHARKLTYHSSFGDTVFLLGTEYSILRDEFWKIPSRVVTNAVRNILVTLGGADPCNLMPRVLSFLSVLRGSFSISAIIGPFFNNIEEVRAVARRANGQIRLVYSPDSVCGLMMEADLAISAGGQTLYELARTGCPTVAVRMASNQDKQLQLFAQAGFVRPVGRADDRSVVSAIGDAVISLLSDSRARSAMSAAGQGLVDGQGALRVAQTILSEMMGSRKQTRNEDRLL